MVVLAAGFSRRFGKPKLLARIGGTSLLAATLRILAPLARNPIIVVVPPRARRLRAELRGCPVRFVENPHRAAGLSSSVRCGLRQARYSAAVLLLPADLGELERRDIARLIARWTASRRRAVARRVGMHGAGPLILPHRLIPDALGISGDAGLRDLIRRLPTDALALVHMPSAALDVDTVHDLARAKNGMYVDKSIY
jgi:molybdenum cofactor cytidylyltransferase